MRLKATIRSTQKPAKGEKRKNEKKGNDEDDKNEGDKKVALQDDEKEKLVQGLSWKSRDRQKMREKAKRSTTPESEGVGSEDGSNNEGHDVRTER